MNPAYTLALKLGIPVIVQPEWNECHRLLEEGRELREEGRGLLPYEGWDLLNKGEKFYKKAVTRELGPEYVVCINWGTGEVGPL